MLLTATTPAVVNVTVNNSPANSAGWFSSVFSGVRAFADAHPYIVYITIGCTVGAAVYFIGGSVLGRTAESALADPASTARLVQRNANLRSEMEATRVSMTEIRDVLTEVKLELAHAQANSLVELTQQRQATDMVVRETAELPIAVNTNILGVHESIT